MLSATMRETQTINVYSTYFENGYGGNCGRHLEKLICIIEAEHFF